jgi:hypothetical protein
MQMSDELGSEILTESLCKMNVQAWNNSCTDLNIGLLVVLLKCVA